jgi:VIT1/CCC1 family predicted Fe2+/Mn2+ transporter
MEEPARRTVLTPARAVHDHDRMSGHTLTRTGVGASIVFGALIAILAILDVPALGTVAALGGVLLFLMWIGIGMARNRAT